MSSARLDTWRFLRNSAFLLLLLAALNGCRHAAAKDGDKKEGPDVRVRVRPAVERMMAERVTGLGRCEAVPEHFAVLTAAAEGRVVGLLKRPGEAVKAGEAIVQLDATIAEKGLVEKERALESQKLAIDQAELAFKKAQLTANHLKQLRQRGEISESAMYDAESAQQQTDLQVQTAKAQYKMAEAAIATAKAQLAQLTIRTPIAGVLNELTCQLGQTLAVGTSVGEVVDAGQLQAVVWLAVADAQRLKPKQTAAVRPCGSSLDQWHGDDMPAAVLDVGKMADPQTGNLPVRVTIDNASGRLALGQAVMASIVLREEKVLAVPKKAVRFSEDDDAAQEGKADLVVVREGKAVTLHPKLGLIDGGWVAVGDKGLKPDEPVVTEGGYHLPDGTAVEIEKEDAAVGRTSESVSEQRTDSEVHPTGSGK